MINPLACKPVTREIWILTRQIREEEKEASFDASVVNGTS